MEHMVVNETYGGGYMTQIIEDQGILLGISTHLYDMKSVVFERDQGMWKPLYAMEGAQIVPLPKCFVPNEAMIVDLNHAYANS